MARLTFNALLEELRGNVGNLVIRKIRGNYFIGQKPQPTRKKPTEGQRAFRQRFRRASEYAKAVQRDPALRSFYEPFARKRDLRVRAVAIGDWFHPPEVKAIQTRRYGGKAGGVIVVTATDDIAVVSVTVSITADDRRLIETGAAVLKAGRWCYVATVTVPAGMSVTIEAVARDRPQNRGVLKQVWPAAVKGG